MSIELVALIVAVLSALFVGLSWWDTRKSRVAAQRSASASEQSADASQTSARAATEVVQLEQDRRHEELQPQIWIGWSDQLVDQGDAWTGGIRLISEGPLDYATVTAKLLPAPMGKPQAATRIQSLQTGEVAEPGEPVSLGELRQGEEALLVIHPARDDDGRPRGGPCRLRLKFETSNDHDPWTMLHDPDIPTPPFGFVS